MPCIVCGHEFEHDPGSELLTEIVDHYEQEHWTEEESTKPAQ